VIFTNFSESAFSDMNNLPEVIFTKVVCFLNADELSSVLTACGKTCNRDYKLLLCFHNTCPIKNASKCPTVPVKSFNHGDKDEDEDSIGVSSNIQKPLLEIRNISGHTFSVNDDAFHNVFNNFVFNVFVTLNDTTAVVDE